MPGDNLPPDVPPSNPVSPPDASSPARHISVYFYDLATGIFNGRIAFHEEGTPPTLLDGEAAWESADPIDPYSQRLDLTQDPPVVVDYQPPAPPQTDDATQAWDAPTKRWRKVPTLNANKKARKAPVQAQIDALEATQAEPVRNLLIALGNGKAGSAPLAKLHAIDDAIAPLKAKLAAISACTTQEQLDAIAP